MMLEGLSLHDQPWFLLLVFEQSLLYHHHLRYHSHLLQYFHLYHDLELFHHHHPLDAFLGDVHYVHLSSAVGIPWVEIPQEIRVHVENLDLAVLLGTILVGNLGRDVVEIPEENVLVLEEVRILLSQGKAAF